MGGARQVCQQVSCHAWVWPAGAPLAHIGPTLLLPSGTHTVFLMVHPYQKQQAAKPPENSPGQAGTHAYLLNPQFQAGAHLS